MAVQFQGSLYLDTRTIRRNRQNVDATRPYEPYLAKYKERCQKELPDSVSVIIQGGFRVQLDPRTRRPIRPVEPTEEIIFAYQDLAGKTQSGGKAIKRQVVERGWFRRKEEPVDAFLERAFKIIQAKTQGKAR